jgi:membrane protein
LSAFLRSFSTGAVPPGLVQALDFLVALAVVGFLFALFFKILPDVQLSWRDVGGGAFVTALLFGIGRFLIALYLAHSTVASVYGAAGSLVALLVWVYYSCAILFFGVELTRVTRLARGPALLPKKNAVLVRSEMVPETGSGQEAGHAAAPRG